MTTTMGTTATTLTSAEGELATAIATFHAAATKSFEAAVGVANTDKEPQETKEAADVRKSKAKGQMTSALEQMAHAETMLSEQRSRVGYDAVVKLMEMTRDVADEVYTKIKTLVHESVVSSNAQQLDRERQLVILGDVLVKLAQISPVSVWQKDPSSGSKG